MDRAASRGTDDPSVSVGVVVSSPVVTGRAGAGEEEEFVRPFWQGPDVPRVVRPMRGVPGPLQQGAMWAHELKWAGLRAMTYVNRGDVRVESQGRDVAEVLPELRELGDELTARSAVLDGALLGMDEEGRPDFEALQRRLHPVASRRDQCASKVALVLFDLVHLDGKSQLDAPYDERRGLLASLGLEGEHWTTTSVIAGDDDPLALARQRGAEGVIAKLRTSRYAAGRRVGAWVHTRAEEAREVAIGGWIPDPRRRGVAAVLCGTTTTDGAELRYLGRVSDGIGAAESVALAERFSKLRRHSSPFAGGVPSAERAVACWVSPIQHAWVSVRPGTDARLRRLHWHGLVEQDAEGIAA